MKDNRSHCGNVIPLNFFFRNLTPINVLVGFKLQIKVPYKLYVWTDINVIVIGTNQLHFYSVLVLQENPLFDKEKKI